jgi:hypothetical protein
VTEEVPIATWLAKPFWPWPLALAYSQAPEKRQAAVSAAIEVLEAYPRRAEMAECTAIGAVGSVYQVVTDEQDVRYLDEETLRHIEAPLLAAVMSGVVLAQGRKTLESLFEGIRVADWVGAEIDAEATADLVRAGWRERSRGLDAMLGRDERVVWFYDVHLPRAGMTKVFGEPAEPSLLDHPSAEAWSHEQMKEAIASCAVGNREKAWAELFKPIRDKHGWDNTAFRAIWSEGRDSKGATGRPAKKRA